MNVHSSIFTSENSYFISRKYTDNKKVYSLKSSPSNYLFILQTKT